MVYYVWYTRAVVCFTSTACLQLLVLVIFNRGFLLRLAASGLNTSSLETLMCETYPKNDTYDSSASQ